MSFKVNKNLMVTPGRKVHVILDDPEYGIVEPSIGEHWVAEQIGPWDQATISKNDGRLSCVFRSGMGWELNQYNTYADAQETTEGQTWALGAAELDVAPNHGLLSAFVQTPDGGYSGDVAASGGLFYKKQVPSGSGLEQRLSADQTAFPGPDVAKDRAPLDRILASKFEHNHLDQGGLVFTMHATGPTVGITDSIGVAYFTGPAGIRRRFVGYGQYALKFSTNGDCLLYERGEGLFSPTDEDLGPVTVDWWFSKVWRFAPNSVGLNSIIRIEVDLILEATGPASMQTTSGSVLRFTTSTPEAQNHHRGQTQVTQYYGQKPPENQVAMYQVPFTKRVDFVSDHAPGLVLPEKIRMDARRTHRPMLRIETKRYEIEGYIDCRPFDVGFLPVGITHNPLLLTWNGSVPPKCSIDAQLWYYNDDGVPQAVSPYSEPDFPTPIRAHYYDLLPNIQYYFVRVYFAGPELADPENTTPLLTSISAIRNPFNSLQGSDANRFEVDVHNFASLVPDRYTAPVLPKSAGEIVTISDAEMNSSANQATVIVQDMVGHLTRLDTRGILPIRIETQYDSADETKRCVLFRGTVRGPRHKNNLVHPVFPKVLGVPTRTEVYGHKWKTRYLTATGMRAQLQERAFQSRRADWSADPNDRDADGNSRPYKVTKVIRIMLGWMGVPPEMIDIPDLPIRFHPGPSANMQLQPFADLIEQAEEYALEWLGRRLFPDESAGPLGIWRLVEPNIAPYNYLAHFVTTTQQDAGKLHFFLPSYGVSVDDGAQICPIEGGTLEPYNQPLEGNMLSISSSGEFAGAQTRLTKIFYNFKSFNFRNLSVGHANYPDINHPDFRTSIIPIYIVDPTLAVSGDEEASEAALTMVGIRVFSVACFTKRLITFRAPLLLVYDESDPHHSLALGKPPRKLRYYDAVTVDGSTFLVKKVDVSIQHDGMQMATYKLEAPREFFL